MRYSGVEGNVDWSETPARSPEKKSDRPTSRPPESGELLNNVSQVRRRIELELEKGRKGSGLDVA